MPVIYLKGNIIFSTKEVIFTMQIVLFVWLYAGLCKTYTTNFRETWCQGVAWAKEVQIKFWSRSETLSNSVSVFLMLQDRALGLGRGLNSTTPHILKSLKFNRDKT